MKNRSALIMGGGAATTPKPKKARFKFINRLIKNHTIYAGWLFRVLDIKAMIVALDDPFTPKYRF